MKPAVKHNGGSVIVRADLHTLYAIDTIDGSKCELLSKSGHQLSSGWGFSGAAPNIAHVL